MRSTVILLSLIMPSHILAQQANNSNSQLPSAEFLQFLADFDLQSDDDDKDYDIIQHHALQDLEKKPSQEHNNDL